MSSAGLAYDRPFMYGKQFRLFYVEWTMGPAGFPASIKGQGFGFTAARPHQGQIVKQAGTGDFRIIMPGDGRSWNLLSPMGMFAYDEFSNYAMILRNIDRDEGAIDITTTLADHETAVTLPDGAIAGLTIISSDWPHF